MKRKGSGNDWSEELVYSCPKCGEGNLCDVCHEHDLPRGECDQCPLAQVGSSADLFGGIDRSIAEKGAIDLIGCSDPFTYDMLKDGIRRLQELSDNPPSLCGSKESPHLVAPARQGEAVPYRRCVQCGDHGFVNFETGVFVENAPPEKL